MASLFFLISLVLLPFCLAVQSGSDSGTIGISGDGNMIGIGVTPPRCGDGHLDTGEQCDGSVGGLTCSDLNSNWTGILSCQSSCIWDTSGCSSIPTETPPQNNGGNSGGGGGSPSSSSSSGGGGGGITTLSTSNQEQTCVENWVCKAWSNTKDECGTRTCVDENECGTFKLKPITSKECPSIKISSITGNIVGGVSNFAKSRPGIVVLFVLVVVAFVIVITLYRSKVKKKAISGSEPQS